MTSKALQLLGLLPLRPTEFCDRVLARIQVQWSAGHSYSYQSVSFALAVIELGRVLHKDLTSKLFETELAATEARLEVLQSGMSSTAPFPQFHNGGSALARMCYALARVLQPKSVLETGVCYGVTSAHFLRALEKNGRGELHSIDLPPLSHNGDAYVGALVPQELRSRWQLHRGSTRRLLAPVLERLAPIDMFLHDSLHTFGNMRSEFDAVWPALRPGGVLIADDVEGNAAFQELVQRTDVVHACVVREIAKDSLFGVAVKAS
jgi:predicted O-methyltransferase YrrM